MGKSLYFQDVIKTLQDFWIEQDCYIGQPYDIEKGAGIMNPLTFFRVLGPQLLEHGLCRNHAEGPRMPGMGTTPTEWAITFSLQVILKPPDKIMDIYINSLERLGDKGRSRI